MKVKKRDKTLEVFQREKVKNAISKAFEACDRLYDASVLKCVLSRFDGKGEDDVVDVEEIQDVIEECLMMYSPQIAKAFIIYRYEHKVLRDRQDKLTKTMAKKLMADEIENQNANVDEYSFGGRMGEAMRVVTKDYALNYCMSKKSKKNHLDNMIYIHDLDSYSVGEANCLSIPFDHLLNDGFNTRQTDVRPAKSINTAMQLVAVLFQLQSLQQFGGVSATHLDWTMVPFVRNSFYKHYKDGMEFLLGESIERVGVDSTTSIESELYKNNKKVYEYALKLTKRELKQAVEGLYHNLNTLQSRSGNQLPFTSVNYGTCTLPEGRMVIKALLKGSINGVGKYHKTPIFPCGIFQCKEGVNRHKGDPNYDLFRLALKSTAQRIYPNYANADVSMQKGWVKTDREQKQQVLDELTEGEYKVLVKRIKDDPSLGDKLFLDVKDDKLVLQQDEKPFEIFSTMGCVAGFEQIVYKYGNEEDAKIKTFTHAWEEFAKKYGATQQIDDVDDHLFIEPNDLWVIDKDNTYTKVKKVIRNTSINWVSLTYDMWVNETYNSLTCTPDHPLPIVGKGRITADEIEIGDKLYTDNEDIYVTILEKNYFTHEMFSYDLETESDTFMVNGIWSHNCRTVNGADINAQISYRTNIQSVIKDGTIKDTILSAAQKDGRGNICPVTIILPTLAMEAEKDKAKFMKLLDKKINEAKDMLIERFEWICKQSPMSAKFMWENNTMSGYIPEEGTRSALRHGTIVIGQIGIAETLQLLLGTDHTTEEGMALAKEIEELFKTRCAEFKEQYKLNFGVYYTPAENLCHTALKNFRAKYGIIENVSDREYFTNSIHVPVWKDMTPFEKVDVESQLTGFSSAGCITYVELEHGVKHNVDAMEEIVSYAMDHDIPYFAINVPIDDCNDCGYSDEINDVCPQCGSENISRLRRCTGYLSGDYKSSFNQGKQEEVEHRVKHCKEIAV